MESQLPKRLGKEPLVQVSFELRLVAHLPLSSILPGVLYSKLNCGDIRKTPHAEIPEVIRNNDPVFSFLPLVTLDWQGYQIHIGDRVIIISCNMPYEGWSSFKKRILELVDELILAPTSNMIDRVERFSLKYTDLIEAPFNSNFSELVNVSVNMGGHDFNLSSTQIRAEKKEGDSLVIMQMSGHAQVVFPDSNERNGLLIDIDCIKNKNRISFSSFCESFEQELNELHLLNKRVFFNFLSEKGLKNLEPTYE
ncbi:TIGR04255 family protein [Serratia fonticola]|uniref:TIGR04255 family protein n=1 Tax=Serratia fonticola TaxID=47917 RepID=UPI00192CAA92|nr:TIGR04255 family protein [Serratia fonticola]MBL5905959.1 TIGR04255 family protein [Serratia fonticola]